jgi:CheY-like chemotaxis protein
MSAKIAKEILLVEDNPDDAELTRIAFAEAGVDYRLHAVGDGVQARRTCRRWSCWTSTCPSSTAAKCWRRSAPNPPPAACRWWC